MGVRGVICTIASIFLLFSLIRAGIRSKKAMEEASVVSLINSLEKNEDMAERLWIHCRQELMRASGGEDLELVPGDKSRCRNKIIWNGRCMNELDIKKLFKVLHLKAKPGFVDCMRNKNVMFLTSVEEGPSENWYNRYLDFIYTRADASGRRELIQNFAGAPAPSPAIGSPAPPPTVGSPAAFPSSPEIRKSHSHPSPLSPTFFPNDLSDSNLQPTPSKRHTPSGSSSSSDVQSNNSNTVLIAVLVTASATIVVSALLFLCCRNACGTGAGGQNDESPLLSLSLSDYSVASSQKSFAMVNQEKPSNLSINAIPSHNKIAGDMYLDTNTLGDSKVESPIAPVAGAGDSTPGPLAMAGLPPLKPPPGRVMSSIPPTIGPGKGAPAPAPTPPPPPRPPPAPAPPPPPKPSSSGPRPPVPGPPPPPPVKKSGPRPPPPPGGGVPPPRPPPMGLKLPHPSPLGPKNPSTFTTDELDDDGLPKAKLKPFFWDKVLANPDHSMVWHQIKAGSFQFNEEMIETLFGYAPPDKNLNNSKESSAQGSSKQYIQIIDAKKSQNLAILLKALNVTTEEVCDALQEGNELPSEFVQTLLKMAPTTDEELKLRLFSGDLSCLGPAERFLKVLVDIPFAFKRLECLLFMSTFQEEASVVKDSFATLEAACTDLRKSRLFLKLLEAVLKTGNRMNDGTFRGGAQAFKLDTLLKLSDVKGKDGKTTLLHFVVQEIIRSEGIRAARAAGASRSLSSIKSEDLLDDSSPDTEEHFRSIGLQRVSGLSDELENVKKAAVIDAESLTGTVARLGHALIRSRDFLDSEMKNVDEDNGFQQTLKEFVQNSEADIMSLLAEEKRIMALVKSTGDYFHGNSAKDEGLRLFVIVRDFLIILDKVCKEVKITPRVPCKTPRKEDTTTAPSEPPQSPSPDRRQQLETTTVPSQPPQSPSLDPRPITAAPPWTPQSPSSPDPHPLTAPPQPPQLPAPDPRQRLLPAIKHRRIDSSSSSDDDDQ